MFEDILRPARSFKIMPVAIKAENLTRTFKAHIRQEGVLASLKGLFKRQYRLIDAVKTVSFEIEQGELVGFIGPNGAGKTTTLKMLSGLLHPTAGTAKVLGFTPSDRKSQFLRQISLVMGQKNQLFWDLPAIETFRMNKEIYDVNAKRYKEVVGELAELLDVKDEIYQQVRRLSLGQRMKCELIASLVHTPKILFLDEPTIGLDVVTQKKLRDFIKEYNQKYNATIILTSHYMGDIEELCERVIIIDKGELGYDGQLDELVKSYAPNKVIKLIFLKKIKEDDVKKYGRIISFDPLEVILEVPRNATKEIASRVLRELPVDDLDIAEVPIEDIIRQVFEKNKA